MPWWSILLFTAISAVIAVCLGFSESRSSADAHGADGVATLVLFSHRYDWLPDFNQVCDSGHGSFRAPWAAYVSVP